jgi:hypothetical protein
MALRLVLVSAVAGLGLSLPTRTEVATWTDSARVWVTARLAAWDAQMPAGEDAFVFVADSAPTSHEHVAVVSTAAAKPATTPVPAPSVAARTERPTPAPACCRIPLPPTAETACQTGLDLTAGQWIPDEPIAFDESEPQPPRPSVAVTQPSKTVVAPNAAFDIAMNAVVAAFAVDLPARKAPESPAIVRTETKKTPDAAKSATKKTSVVAKTETKKAPVVAKTETKKAPIVVRPEIKKTPVVTKTKTKKAPIVVRPEIKKTPVVAKTESKKTPVVAKTESKKAPEVVKTGTKKTPVVAKTETKKAPEVVKTETKKTPVVAKTAAKKAPEVVKPETRKTPVVAKSETKKVSEVVKGETKTSANWEPLLVDDDLYIGIAYALNNQADGLEHGAAAKPTAARTTSMPRPTPSVAPIAVGDVLSPGLAFTKKRPAGTKEPIPAPAHQVVASAPAPRNEVPSTGARLTHAMRLTREAVFAWANLLHGPVVVTISK